MKKRNLLGLLILGAISLSACSKKGCIDEVAENYDADAKKDDGSCTYIEGCTDETSANYDSDATKDDGNCSDFASYMNWMLEATNTGVDPAMAAHGINDSTVTRSVYVMDGQDAVGGKYPVGTMIVKHSVNAAGTLNERTAMVKQKEGFNPAGNDWEWFMLAADGSIAKDAGGALMRGATLMDGMCQSCHAGAGVDFVFSK